MNKALHILRLLLFSASAFFCLAASAQSARIFLNKQEINQQSVYFLNAATIDSVKFCYGLEASGKFGLKVAPTDSVYIIFKKDVSDIRSYYGLLEAYHLAKQARELPLDLGLYPHRYIEHREQMVFSWSQLSEVLVHINPITSFKSIYIFEGYRRPYSSDAGRTLTWLQGYVNGNSNNSYYKQFKTK